MHILLIHQAFAALDEPGGTRHHELARFLVTRGHRVTVITSAVSYLTGDKHNDTIRKQADNQAGGITILRASTYSALHRSFFHRVFVFFSFMVSSFWIGLGVKNVDVVWGTSPPIFQGVTAWALARLKRARFLFEVRDLWPDFAIAVGVLKNPILIRLSYWLERFLYHRADRVVVNSPGYQAHVTQRGARHVDLVPNGADPGMFDPSADGSAFRGRNNLADKFVVLYAGAHGLSNDLGVALESAKLLEQEAPQVCIVFLGDGKEKPNLTRQAETMGLENVLFLPPVPKMEMAEALAGADACLAILKPIDEYKTTYPNKVFDYMAAGRAVVLAVDGVIREVVEAAGCGLFVQPGNPSALADAIRGMAGSKENTHRMGLAGRKYVERKFNRLKIAELFEEVLLST